MLKTTLTLSNKLGLHARASMKLVNLAGRFGSEIILQFNGRTVNAKSILNVMMLGATFGDEIEVSIEGSDEERALNEVTNLFNEKFGEE